jgi:hypothetical protein
MSNEHKRPAVVVSDIAAASGDPIDIIHSNIEFVNAQFSEHLTHEEVGENALRSYYVDYFLAQLENGGFSQFVYNSRWGDCIDYIIEGFAAMGAARHLELFENAAEQMAQRPGVEGLRRFFASDYFGDNEERDILNEFNDAFFALSDVENLVELNAGWLRHLPELVVLSEAEMREELRQRVEAIPDLEKRVEAALAAEPRDMKLIRSLCNATGMKFDRVTAGDPSGSFEGGQVTSWHFLTDEGHFHMIEADGKAIMRRGHTDEVVCEIKVEGED